MLRIRAFHAPDDQEAGERFAIGHKSVLEDLGVKVTSGSADWISDPNVYVIVVEDTKNDNHIVGGARVHLAHFNGVLPMVEAVSKVDDKIGSEIEKLIPARTAELCGMWNSRAVMGLGLGAKYVMRSAIALADQLELGTMLSFASRATRQRGYDKGFEPLVTVGDRGEFNYPKLDLIATAVICYDPQVLSLAKPEERDEIMKLRNKLDFETSEKWPKGEFDVHYALDMKLRKLVQ